MVLWGYTPRQLPDPIQWTKLMCNNNGQIMVHGKNKRVKIHPLSVKKIKLNEWKLTLEEEKFTSKRVKGFTL